MLDPVNAEAGTLSDLFFMKHGLEHMMFRQSSPILAPWLPRF